MRSAHRLDPCDEGALRREIESLPRDPDRGGVLCKDLLDLAARAGVSPHTLGRLCNEAGLRIRNCQLGCFP